MPFNGRHGPRGIVARTLGLAGASLIAAALLVWTPSVATGWNQGTAEAKLWQLMNGARVNNGLRPVQQNSTLVSLARWRSKDQIRRDYFSHTVLGTSYQVFHWYDLNGLNYRYGGENIGWNSGYSDADSAVAIHEGFMNSPSHRANILNRDWTHGGVGAYAADNVSYLGKLRSPRFFTELFMQSASAAPPPPPSSTPPPPPPPGGGGGGTRNVSAAPTSPRADREASEAQMASPSRPRSGQPLDGAELLASSAPRLVADAKLAMLAFADGWQGLERAAPQVLSSTADAGPTYRVETSAASQGGLFDSVLGSLLGGVPR
jgi:uncharacterized protein YkwD